MKTFYLIAYTTDYPRKALDFPRADVRKIEATSSKKAEPMREAYERELNGGELWSTDYLVACEKEGKPVERRRVDLISFTDAREFRDFNSWPCNKEEMGYEEDLTGEMLDALRFAASVLKDYAPSDTGAKAALNQCNAVLAKAEKREAVEA